MAKKDKSAKQDSKKGGGDADERFLARWRVPADGKRFRLADRSTDDKAGFADRETSEAILPDEIAAINGMQERLYASAKQAVLVVLQAMDTGGKDGAVRHVFGPLDAQGVTVTSFKKPTVPEMAHDYLWRIHQAVPPKGLIGVFNRSHYEDVLVPRVHEWIPRERLDLRYDQINTFERYLDENDVTIVKFFLHISKDEQKRRLQARLDDPTKHWKFEHGDLAERKMWNRYQDSYERALARCSTTVAPWYVIPADRKWVRNVLIARILRVTMERLKLTYPPAPEGLKNIVIDG